jgi:hypothetical protein
MNKSKYQPLPALREEVPAESLKNLNAVFFGNQLDCLSASKASSLD